MLFERITNADHQNTDLTAQVSVLTQNSQALSEECSKLKETLVQLKIQLNASEEILQEKDKEITRLSTLLTGSEESTQRTQAELDMLQTGIQDAKSALAKVQQEKEQLVSENKQNLATLRAEHQRAEEALKQHHSRELEECRKQVRVRGATRSVKQVSWAGH